MTNNMLPPIEYIRAENLSFALEQLDRLESEKRVLAGGTDLLIKLRDNQSREAVTLIDISGLTELSQIEANNSVLTIGSGVTFSRIINSAEIGKFVPVLKQAVELIGSVQIRNRGTIGGNICNASPCADSAPVLLVTNTQVETLSIKGKRLLPIDQFLTAPNQTALELNEIVTKFHLEKLPENAGSAFIKLGRRNAMSIARMNVAAVLQIDNDRIYDARIAVGSVMPTAARINAAEQLLKEKPPSEKIFEAAGKKVAEEMIRITGRRWSTEYKQPVIQVLVKRALMEAWRAKQ